MSSATKTLPATTSSPHTSCSYTSFTAVACVLFVILGIVTTLLGPILPLLSVRWSISAAQAGSLFLWQFIPSTFGTLLSGAVLSKRSFRLVVITGIALCFLGVASLIQADWNLGRYAVASYGFGLGIALPAMNLAVAQANPTRRAASVSVLNFSWGIGAVIGPVLLRTAHSLELFLILLAVVIALALIGSTLTRMPAREAHTTSPGAELHHRTDLRVLIPLLAFAMFLFCGVENAIAGWASSLALPKFSNAYAATSATIAFWALFLAGRALAPAALRVVSEPGLLLTSIILAVAGVLGLYFAVDAPRILLACAVAGLGVGPGFPLVISKVSESIGPRHPAATVCFAFAGVGAATMSSLVGVIGGKVGEPRAGLIIPIAGLLILLAVSRAFRQHNVSIAGAV
jgi:MFS transporter, FHS family, glucose/mannose:H+ symporter